MRNFISVALLAGASLIASAQNYPDLYLRGDITGAWGVQESYKFIREGENHYTLTVPELRDAFKISNSDWTVNLGVPAGDDALIASSRTVRSVHDGENYQANGLRDVTISFDLNMDGGVAAETNVTFTVSGTPVDPTDNRVSGTLPVFYINTENNQPITTKEYYLKATYWLDPMGVEGIEAIGSASEPLGMQIRGRGNYTWRAFEKKPYRIKLDKKAGLLGMNSNKHFALLAHADDDRAFMRNATGFQVSRLSGLPWTPADEPCEVVLNGDYIGLYFLTEVIRFDKKRINMTNPDDEVEDWLAENPGMSADQYPWAEGDYSGPWIVEFDNTEDVGQLTIPTLQHCEEPFRVTYKKPEDYVTDRHREWLYNEIVEIDRMLYGNTRAGANWTDKIDLTDAARFFVVNQIMNNYESYHGSCYLTRARGENEKWHFSPVWDFGSAFQPSRDQSKWIWDSEWDQHWIRAMWDNPQFQAEVKRQFEEIKANGLNDIYNYQNAYVARIKAAAAKDYQRWGNKGYGNPDMDGKLREVQDQLRTSINSFATKLGSVVTDPDPIDPENAPVLYLRGDINGWGTSDDYKFSTTDGTNYSLKANDFSGSFKIADSNWGDYDLGFGGGPLDFNTPYTLEDRGGNIELSTSPVKNVVFQLDLSKKELRVRNTTGVEEIGAGNEAEAVYFNLQGIAIEQPEKGRIVIRVVGNRAEKIIY